MENDKIISLIHQVYMENVINDRKMQMLTSKVYDKLMIYLISQNHDNIYKLNSLYEQHKYKILHRLQDELLLDNPTYLEKFNKIAKSYNYFFKGDIQEAASILTTSNSLDNDIEKWKRSLLIKDINTIKEKEFIIDTDFGEIYFQSARDKYIEETNRVVERTKLKYKGQYEISGIRYQCHLSALEFIKTHRDHYIITSICPHMFLSTWWFHSYVLTPDKNTVIDLATNVIMERITFEKLFEPNVLMMFEQSDIERICEKQGLNDYDAFISCAIMKRGKQLEKRLLLSKM